MTADMERELAEAWTTLDAAADATDAAYEVAWGAQSDRAESRAWARWNKLHDAQNRAAGRLHAANRALGRPACDDRRTATA